MKLKLRILTLFFLTLVVLPGFIWMLFTGKIAQALTPSATDAVIYNDALSNTWQNWSWNASVDFNASDAPKTGTKAIAATLNAWGGLYLHTDQSINAADAESFVVSVKPTLENSNFNVILYDENNNLIGSPQPLTTFGPAPAVNVWSEYIIPVPANRSLKGIAIQDNTGKSNNKVYFDDYFVKKKAMASSTGAESTQQSNTTVYNDGLSNGWENWSWSSNVNADNYWPVASGNRSIAFTPHSAWAGLYLHKNSAIDTAGMQNLQFRLYVTQANQQFAVALVNENNQLTANPVSLDKYGAPTVNGWKTYSIPLQDVAATNKRISGVIFQEAKGQSQPTVYVDEIAFGTTVAGVTGTVQPTQTANPTTSPTPTPTATAKVGTPPSEKQFVTFGPGAALPSGEMCAGLVRRSTWEPRPENTQANNTKGFQLTTRIDGANAAGNAKYLSRIDGNFTGTTDEIIQWGACKWGLDEDIVRAVAAQESWWRQSTLGDWNGKDYESYGLLQVRRTYHEGTYPIARESVPFNVDYALAWRRACMDGYFDWIPAEAKGDEWGCVGLWFSGRWKDGDPNVAYSGANWYISKVKGYLDSKVWLSPDFPTK